MEFFAGLFKAYLDFVRPRAFVLFFSFLALNMMFSFADELPDSSDMTTRLFAFALSCRYLSDLVLIASERLSNPYLTYLTIPLVLELLVALLRPS